MSAKTEAPAGLAFAWVDSEVASVRADAHTVDVRLAAAQLCGPGERYLGGLRLVMQAQVRSGNPQDALGRVTTASLIIQGQAVKSLPVPSQHAVPFSLDLGFGTGSRLRIEGQHLAVLLPEEPRIIERLSC